MKKLTTLLCTLFLVSFSLFGSTNSHSSEQDWEENILGTWVIPNNPYRIAIIFMRDGSFMFVDYNDVRKKRELLQGTFELLDNGKIDLLFYDRSKLSFRYKLKAGKATIQNYNGKYTFEKTKVNFKAYVEGDEDLFNPEKKGSPVKKSQNSNLKKT